MSEYPKIGKDEFYKLEFDVSDDMPEWVLPDVKGIKANLAGHEIILCRNNTIIFDFDYLYDPETKYTYNFDWMSHIYIHRGKGEKPFWHLKPEDESEVHHWDDLAKRLIDIDCEYRTGIPKELDFAMFYTYLRGETPMVDGIEEILDAGK